ncbi:DUF1330 domain-containing protein [Streptomyces sp. NPDC051173]|uniref:DUF1330 domain-containing protein n=1 Tax=Streptomyces sp. NPDC051173 TaxID=3155164 RepID=UPI00344F826E
MTAPRGYAIGYLKNVEIGPEIAKYTERVEATTAPYGGQFLVYGGQFVGGWDLVRRHCHAGVPRSGQRAVVVQVVGLSAILLLRTEYATSMVALVS